MREGYEFNKNNVDYNDLKNYVEGIIDALKNWSYSTGISGKNNQQFLKAAESLKADIIGIQRLFLTEAEFSSILPYQMHSKSANNLVSDNIDALRKQQQVLNARIKSNIAKLWNAPSTLGIKEDKQNGTIETKTKQQLDSDEKGKDYGFASYNYKGNFAQVDRELLDDMYDICEKRSKEECLKACSTSREYIETQEAKKTQSAINDNEYFFDRSFDTKGTVRYNPDSIHILRELSEINEEKFCLGLEIPDEVYENASPKELKMIEKYKKAISKKKEALAKIEKQTMELVGPRRNKSDIKMTIEHLSGDLKIPQETKQKLLKTLNTQLREEEKKEAKIHKQIDRQRKKGKIEKYDKSRYELYSDMEKTQKDYESSSIEASNEKTYLQDDIVRLTETLDNKTLSENERLDFEAQLTQKKKRLYSLGDNSLNADERHNYKNKIISFWKYTIAKEVSPRKQEPLLLTAGAQKVSKRGEFASELNYTPEITNTPPTTEKAPTLKHNATKDGIEPGDD